MELCRFAIEKTSGNPHSSTVSKAPCTVSEMRVKWRIGVTFSNTPCNAIRVKNTNSAASDEDTNIAGTSPKVLGFQYPATTMGRIRLGRNVVATINNPASARKALHM